MTPQVNVHRTDTPTPHPPRNARRVWLADPVRHTQTGMRPTTHRRATRAGSGRGISSSLNIAATSKMLFFRYKFDHRAVSLRGSLRDAQRVAGAAEIPNHDNAEAHPPTPQEQTGRGKGRRKVWSNEVNVNILHGTFVWRCAKNKGTPTTAPKAASRAPLQLCCAVVRCIHHSWTERGPRVFKIKRPSHTATTEYLQK